jgi:hypothetical protein
MKSIEWNVPTAGEQALRDGQVEDVLVLREGYPVGQEELRKQLGMK